MRSMYAAFLLGILGLLVSGNVLGSELSFENNGIVIKTKGMNDLVLEYPKIMLEKTDYNGQDPKDKRVTKSEAVMKYANGAEIVIGKEKDGFTIDTKGDLFAYRMNMKIDFDFRNGGKWQVKDGKLQAFPENKPEQAFLYQGNNTFFKLVAPNDKAVTFGLPQYSFQQLQDNREWNWKIFHWFFQVPITEQNPQVKVVVK